MQTLAGFRRRPRRRDGRQHVVFDVNRVGAVLRRIEGVGDDHGDRLADESRLVEGERIVRRREYRRPVAVDQRRLGTVGGRGHVRHRLESVLLHVAAGKHADHARHAERARRVDRDDARMGMRRPHKHGVSLARQVHIVAETALPLEQARVFLAQHGAAYGRQGSARGRSGRSRHSL
jgi:hypothetical protein